MPLNHMFMPDVEKDLRVRYHRLKIVFHPPILTAGLTLADIPALKETVAAQLAGDFLPEGAEKPGPSGRSTNWRKAPEASAARTAAMPMPVARSSNTATAAGATSGAPSTADADRATGAECAAEAQHATSKSTSVRVMRRVTIVGMGLLPEPTDQSCGHRL